MIWCIDGAFFFVVLLLLLLLLLLFFLVCNHGSRMIKDGSGGTFRDRMAGVGNGRVECIILIVYGKRDRRIKI